MSDVGRQLVRGRDIHVVFPCERTQRNLTMDLQLQTRDRYVHVYGKYVYSTLALGKEREIVKEETALRKEKEAVCCYVHVHVQTVQGCIYMYMYIHVHVHVHVYVCVIYISHSHVCTYNVHCTCDTKEQ